MLFYYFIAACAFSVGFLVAAALALGRRAQSDCERTWLADEIMIFAEKCRSRSNDGRFLVAPEDLQRLEDAAATANQQTK